MFALKTKIMRIFKLPMISGILLLSVFQFVSCRSITENVPASTTIGSLEAQKQLKIEELKEKEDVSETIEINKEYEDATITFGNENLTSETTTKIPDYSFRHMNDYEFSNAVHLYFDFMIDEEVGISMDETAQTISLPLKVEMHWNVNVTEVNKEHFIPSLQTQNEYYVKRGRENEIWTPVIAFHENVDLSKQSLIRHLSFLSYMENRGKMLYRSGEVIKFSCPMNFQYYPADTQQCQFTLVDYTPGRTILFEGDVLNDYLKDNNFDIRLATYGGLWQREYLNNVYYGSYRFTLSIRRKLGYHMVQTFLPSVLYILITCLCFLVPSHMVEVRMGISMTTLLTLTAMFASVRESTPTVSYVKAIDIWMAFCIFFVFLTLLEFTTLLWLRSQRAAAEERRLKDQKRLQALESVIGGKSLGGPVPGLERSFSLKSLHRHEYEKFAEVVEKYGFFVFSFLFLTFVAIYWSWLLKVSRYYKVSKWDYSQE